MEVNKLHTNTINTQTLVTIINDFINQVKKEHHFILEWNFDINQIINDFLLKFDFNDIQITDIKENLSSIEFGTELVELIKLLSEINYVNNPKYLILISSIIWFLHWYSEKFNKHYILVKYDKNWKPTLWNKNMEEETWYTYEEIIKYYEEHWEVMTLLYKWENIKKVEEYLNKIKETWLWYKNIAFTMTTKNWEEKIFLWTTFPDLEGGTIRTARLLIDENEIKKELENTKKLLKMDVLTWIYNKRAFIEDIDKKIFDKRRKLPFIVSMFDIDNFKSINDKLWHNIWDKVLIELTKFLKLKIRNTDVLYRLHWDEFVIIFESDNILELSKKINKIREEFFSYVKEKIGLEKWVWTSWWSICIPVLKPGLKIDFNEEFQKIDKYMYAVKYFKLISDILIAKNDINEGFEEKNGTAYPLFNDNWDFVWVNILKSNWTMFLSRADLNLIIERKKEIDDRKMRL